MAELPLTGPMYLVVTIKRTRYLYLWLKYVTGFDISNHCATCLEGHYSKLLPYRRRLEPGQRFEGLLNEHQAPYVYLCGVTPSYPENLHIPMRYKQGHTVEYEDANIVVKALHAERLSIEPVDLPLPSAFTTCRNFQFGYHAFPVLPDAR